MRAVVGLGDAERGDEGVGPRVLELMKPCPDTFRLQPSKDMMSLLELGRSCQEIIVVDSARSGGEPGSVLSMELVGTMSESLKKERRNLLGPFLHGFDLSQVLMMAEQMGELPTRLTLYGVVGKSFSRGAGLSEPVEAAARELAAMLSSQHGA